MRLFLLLLRGSLVVTIPLILVFGLWQRPQAPTSDSIRTPGTLTSSSEPPRLRHDLAWYSPLWTRNLKESPIPEIGATASTTPEPPRNLPVLLATLVEPQGCFAHFASANGVPRLRGLQESIDNYVVKDIQPGRVQLQVGDATVWVELPRPKGGS